MFKGIKTDPRTNIVRGIVNKDEDTIFDSWIYDSRRRSVYGTNNHIIFDSNLLRFFSYGSIDPRRSNHATPGYFAGNQTFRITDIGLHIAFPDRRVETEFVRSSVLGLDVGDMPIHQMHGQLLAQPAPFSERLESADPAESGLRVWVHMKRPIPIPPRQGFNIQLTLGPVLVDLLKDLTQRRDSFGMIKVMMKGYRTRSVFEDQLTEEDKERLAKQHEEYMQAMEKERLYSEERTKNEESRLNEMMAFLVNTIAPAGTDVNPDHIAKAKYVIYEVMATIYAIGGGGYAGGVPPFENFEYGIIDELQAGKHVRGFPKNNEVDIDRLNFEAWRIAKEYVLEGKSLGEEYRKVVAKSVGVDDYESAIVNTDEDIFH